MAGPHEYSMAISSSNSTLLSNRTLINSSILLTIHNAPPQYGYYPRIKPNQLLTAELHAKTSLS
ncbi:hypothetical protein NW754_016646 [Fusarium falciforme]|nr:hypothetical protein NW754_016646 [Fusarium falciforme]